MSSRAVVFIFVLFFSLLFPSSMSAEQEDICYSEVENLGGTMCIGIFGFEGGIGCGRRITLQNQSGETLENVQIVLKQDSLANGEFISDCSIDGEEKTGDACDNNNTINVGPFSGGVFGINQGVLYDPMPDFSANSEHNISYTSAISATLFDNDNLYAAYEKNGNSYVGKVRICQAPTVEFDAAQYHFDKPAIDGYQDSITYQKVKIVLSKPLDYNITVEYETYENPDGTEFSARDGTDYEANTPNPETVTFAAGETEKTVETKILRNDLLKLAQTFHARLQNPDGSGPVEIGDRNTTDLIINSQGEDAVPLCFSDNFQQELDSKWRTLFSSGGFEPAIYNGRLRLTERVNDLATAVTKDYEFLAKHNMIIVEFDQFAYGGCRDDQDHDSGTYGADGIVMTLFDSAVGDSPQPGAYGGSMGYAQGHNMPGFENGWLGLGIDEYGNFNNNKEDREGGPGCGASVEPNNITIRGMSGEFSESDRYNGYQCLGAVTDIDPVAQKENTPFPNDTYRLKIDARDPGKLLVSLERNGQTIIPAFDAKDEQTYIPEYLRLAFTAGTGDGCNNHEIDYLTVHGVCRSYYPEEGEDTGRFNAVHDHDPVYSSYPTNGAHPNNALYTQISEAPFDVDVVSLDPDSPSEPMNYDGPVLLDVIEDDGSCSSTPAVSYSQTLYFDDEKKISADDVVIDQSYRKMKFRVGVTNYTESWENVIEDLPNENNCVASSRAGNLAGVPQCFNARNQISNILGEELAVKCADENGEPCKSNNHGEGTAPYDHGYGCAECLLGEFEEDIERDYVCSRDSFAVRPKKLKIDTTGVIPDPSSDTITAGENIAIQIEAEDDSSNTDSGYEQNVTNLKVFEKRYLRDGSLDTGSKLVGDINITSANSFSSGIAANTLIQYSDVGEAEGVFYDVEWASVDAKDESVQPNTIEVNGTLSKFEAVPDRFVIDSLTLDNYEGRNYTYLSSDANISQMAAPIVYEINATNANGEITKNYGDRTLGLWEQDVNVTANLTYNKLNPAYNQNANFTIMQNMDLDFINGVATTTPNADNVIEFNFDRNASIVHEPFVLSGSDLNASNFDVNVSDLDDNVSGSSSVADGNTTFYYASLYTPDIKTDKNPVNAKMYIEVFCKNGSAGNDCASFALTQKSVDRINWWQFPQHQNDSGDLNQTYAQPADVDIAGTGTSNTNLNRNISTGGQENVGFEYEGSKNRYKTKVTYEPSSWLSYHKYIPYDADDNTQNFFYIQWDLGAGDWAGVGNVKSTVDVNASDNAQQRIDW